MHLKYYCDQGSIGFTRMVAKAVQDTRKAKGLTLLEHGYWDFVQKPALSPLYFQILSPLSQVTSQWGRHCSTVFAPGNCPEKGKDADALNTTISEATYPFSAADLTHQTLLSQVQGLQTPQAWKHLSLLTP